MSASRRVRRNPVQPSRVQRNQIRRGRSGFTLMEVLLVLVILVALVSVVVVNLVPAQQTASAQTARVTIGGIENALKLYNIHVNSFPTGNQGLAALLVMPGDLPNPAKWRGPYLEGSELPLDPWDRPFQYASPGQRNVGSFDVWSLGPDGQDGTADDVGNWK
jgi:general secretion pathway protein G